MSIVVNKNSKVLVQGFTGSEGTFHSEQMIEYGKILPQSGKEIDWFNSLSKTLQKKLKKIDE